MAGFLGQFRMCEESKNSQPVVISNHHRALLGERFAVIHGKRSSATGESATVGPDDYGAAFAGGFRGGPYVEIEAVLAGSRSRRAGRSPLLLHTHGAELVGFADAFPMRRRPRLAPAQIAHGRR